ncbi:hypothetical protein [Hyphomicrobium sp. CS1BSMeth3]|uniref:hypothetical protein n=1 Tax=Hyphomicrobium sp. CS1BSMeth3 TaxID=1892844 RepID=UPI001FCCE4E1|nr:hypothetical protein [Hyphomicrobium sp. CS1BSMeth3]
MLVHLDPVEERCQLRPAEGNLTRRQPLAHHLPEPHEHGRIHPGGGHLAAHCSVQRCFGCIAVGAKRGHAFPQQIICLRASVLYQAIESAQAVLDRRHLLLERADALRKVSRFGGETVGERG